jgi:hypothetical protein
LWLTAVSNLNDPSELKHGFSRAVEIIKRRSADGPPESKKFAEQFEGFFVGGIDAVASCFVGCFSTTGNDLGQWRAYADDGRGFALAFDTALLEDAFVKVSALSTSNKITFRVTYDDEKAERLQTKIIDAMFPLLALSTGRQVEPPALYDYRVDLLAATCMHCLRAAVYFKHEAYVNEAEYRFLHNETDPKNPEPEVKFRSRPYELVRYREFHWAAGARSALTKVIIGPAADKAKAMLFARECLRAYHRGQSVELTASGIPYRSPPAQRGQDFRE